MSQFPSPADLDAWIDPTYHAAYQRGDLHEQFFLKQPFDHAVLPGFFRPEIYASIRSVCSALDVAGSTSDDGSRMNFCLLDSRDLLRFFYGKPLRRFLSALTGRGLAVPPTLEGTFAQMRRFPARSCGFPVHTDFGAEADVGMFLHLTDGWAPGFGGEVGVHAADGHGGYPVLKDIAPIGNTLAMLFFSRNSYHSVKSMNGEWSRECVYFGWKSASST